MPVRSHAALRPLVLAFALSWPTWCAALPQASPEPAPLPVAATEVGGAETAWLVAHDTDSGQAMQALAVLPPAAPPGPWRVLVLLHGLGGSARSWLAATDVVPRLVAAMRSGALPPTLLLLPDGGDGYWADWADGAHPYGRLVVALLDAAAARYPLAPDGAVHGIVGASMGGFGALSLALQHPRRFGFVAALSATDLAIAVADAPKRKVYRNVLGPKAPSPILARINPIDRVRAGAGAGTRFLLAWGDGEARKFREGGERLLRAMRKRRLRVEHRVVKGGRHGWASTWAPLHGWWLARWAAHASKARARSK